MGHDRGSRNDGSGSWTVGLSVAGVVAIVGGVWTFSRDTISRNEFEIVQRDIDRIERELESRTAVSFRQRDFDAAERVWKAQLERVSDRIQSSSERIRALEVEVRELEKRILIGQNDFGEMRED